VVIQITVGKVAVKPHFIGKIATVLQMSVVLWILLKWDAKWLLVWAVCAALCTGGSGFLYVLDGVRQLSGHPSSNPKAAE